MKFGSNLRNLRKLKRLSQEELAEKVNVSRQSVSKWENGDAYPEMNNILELCKIFHCHINDLVNDSIIDIDSLDEEIRMNVVKFKTEQQRKMKALSKAISVISKICRIVCSIAIPFIIVSMVILAIVIGKVDIKDHEIIWNGNNKIKVVEVDNKISLLIKADKVIEVTNQSDIVRIKDILQNNSKLALVSYMEIGFAFLIICLILVIIIFKSLESLFVNINRGSTPFTLENVGYIKKIAYLMITATVLPYVVGLLFEFILKTDLNVEFEMFSLIEILFLFSIAYVFQYGYEIQLDSKGKMYGDENE